MPRHTNQTSAERSGSCSRRRQPVEARGAASARRGFGRGTTATRVPPAWPGPWPRGSAPARRTTPCGDKCCVVRSAFSMRHGAPWVLKLPRLDFTPPGPPWPSWCDARSPQGRCYCRTQRNVNAWRGAYWSFRLFIFLVHRGASSSPRHL